MDAKGIKTLRTSLRLSQRRVAVLTKISQASISWMESGKHPVDAKYADWLWWQVYGRWQRVADMPVRILKQAIRERGEV
jgi:predicted transcriptional regulator